MCWAVSFVAFILERNLWWYSMGGCSCIFNRAVISHMKTRMSAAALEGNCLSLSDDVTVMSLWLEKVII